MQTRIKINIIPTQSTVFYKLPGYQSSLSSGGVQVKILMMRFTLNLLKLRVS